MIQSLPWRSNQDGISKSNAASQLAGTVEHDKNTKNKANQKELPQLITNVSVTSLKLKQNSKQKVLNKPKKQTVSKTEVIPFIPKQDLRPSDICLYLNEALSDISDNELYSLITNVYKPPKHFDFPETERSFRFEEFPWVCYS